MKSILVLMLLTLSACATAPGYQPERARFGYANVIGYKDARIAADMVRLRYTHPDSNQAYVLFLRRAAELTVAGGFTHFSIVAGKSGDEGFGGPMGFNASFPRYEGTVKMSNAGEFRAAELLEQRQAAK